MYNAVQGAAKMTAEVKVIYIIDSDVNTYMHFT